MDIENEVGLQQEKFDRELSTLLVTHAGKWVAYLDGVQHVGDDQWSVFAWAMEHLPRDRGFVVAEVIEAEPAYMTAAFAFGIAR